MSSRSSSLAIASTHSQSNRLRWNAWGVHIHIPRPSRVMSQRAETSRSEKTICLLVPKPARTSNSKVAARTRHKESHPEKEGLTETEGERQRRKWHSPKRYKLASEKSKYWHKQKRIKRIKYTNPEFRKSRMKPQHIPLLQTQHGAKSTPQKSELLSRESTTHNCFYVLERESVWVCVRVCVDIERKYRGHWVKINIRKSAFQ